MPTYDYGCQGCGHQWELEQRISEDPVKKCPKCGKSRAQRLISGGNFILKGGGWYADLYHKPGGSSSSKGSSSSSSSSSSGSKSDTKSESKGTTKGDAKAAAG